MRRVCAPLGALRSKTLLSSVTGSAGGILPIKLQAASLGEDAPAWRAAFAREGRILAPLVVGFLRARTP